MSRPIESAKRMEIGLFMVLVAAPLVFTPFSAAPFLDAKLVLLFLGALVVTLARPQIDSRVALACLIWVTALAVSALTGLDPWWSFFGPSTQRLGVLALLACAVLLNAAGGIDQELLGRLPIWLFWTGAAVSLVAVVGRFVPLGAAMWELGSLGSTLGHRVFVGGVVAAAAVAGATLPFSARNTIGMSIVASALAVSAVRAAWLGALVGLIVALWKLKPSRPSALWFLAPLLLTVTAWTAIDAFLPARDIEYSAAPRFTQLGEGSAADRLHVWQADLRAWSDDWITGSGPGTSWFPYLTNARPSEIRTAGRDWSDAHNILIETGVSAGAIGLLATIGLTGVVLVRTVRGKPDQAWALGVAASLVVVHTLQPVHVVLTPLMFLAAGAALPRPPPERRTIRSHRLVAIAVSLGLLAAGARFAASTLERYGNGYESPAALRWAIVLEPRRIPATRKLARFLAFQGTAQSIAEARTLLQANVTDHPWHPGVRLDAADVEGFLGDLPRAQSWLDAHLRLFPLDPLALAGSAIVAERSGNRQEARRLAGRALALAPDLELAKIVIRRTSPP